MKLDGFSDYKQGDFCSAVDCPVQGELNRASEGSEEFDLIRGKCRDGCLYSAHQFHLWLIDMGYLIVKPEED